MPNVAPICRPLVALLVTAALVACSEAPRPSEPASAGLPARRPPPSGPTDDAGASPVLEAPLIDVGGLLVDDRSQPVVGRPLVVVDRKGRRQEPMTDEEGGFYLQGVAPPYDVLVTQAPSGAVVTPLVFLGLKRNDPRLEVFERDGSPELPASQHLRVAVRLPSCPEALGTCWVAIASVSASGRGGTAGSYTEGTERGVYELEHAFDRPSLNPGESIDVHVLVGNAQYTQYAYARVLHLTATPGASTELESVTPLPLPAGDPVTIAGHASALPDGWQWTLLSELDLPGGATLPLRYDWTPATTLRIPLLPGASWRVAAWAQRPPVEDHPYSGRSSQARSGSLPLTASQVSVDVPPAPQMIRPAVEGTLSRRAPGFRWSASASGLASVVLVDLARGRQCFRLLTAESEIPLSRLEALGLARPEPGDHVFDLTVTLGATVDERTDPDERERRAHFDDRVPGAITYQRFRFQVTP